jgi:hypothetical protein
MLRYRKRVVSSEGGSVRVLWLVIAAILVIWLFGALIGLVSRAIQVLLIVVLLFLVLRALTGRKFF